MLKRNLSFVILPLKATQQRAKCHKYTIQKCTLQNITQNIINIIMMMPRITCQIKHQQHKMSLFNTWNNRKTNQTNFIWLVDVTQFRSRSPIDKGQFLIDILKHTQNKKPQTNVVYILAFSLPFNYLTVADKTFAIHPLERWHFCQVDSFGSQYLMLEYGFSLEIAWNLLAEWKMEEKHYNLLQVLYSKRMPLLCSVEQNP